MENTRIRDVMTSPAITIAPDTTVPAAMAIMTQNRFRHLPVVENGKLVGIVSRGDLREASSKEAINADTYELNFMLSRLRVGQIMARKVVSITADAFIVDAAELMTERKLGGLPVVDQDYSVIGIVTGSDLLRLLVRKLREVENSASQPSG